MNCLRPLALAISFLSISISAAAQANLTVEGGAAWQSRNDQRVPGDAGTMFSLSDFDTGAFAVYRIYASLRLGERHEIRALYAPFQISSEGSFAQAVTFNGSTFAANTNTEVFYKFNSYRLTYAHHFDQTEKWAFAVGFTAKVRDAEVRLTQPGTETSKKNVGFVPLLHLQAARNLATNWRFHFDLDGLAASQGRAFDAALTLRYQPKAAGFASYLGYRTLEGGADNNEVYNFAWIHYAIIGLTVTH